MMKKRKQLAVLFLCVIMTAFITAPLRVGAYNHPQGLWEHFERWNTAVANNDYDTILELAPIIESLYKGENLNTDNSSMMSIVCENAARGCELRGDLEGAVQWLKKQLVYDVYLNENGSDYYDRITLAKALLRQLDITLDIYTVSENPVGVPYFGALGEPKVGTLQGSAAGSAHAPTTGTIQSGESAILVYVEFEPDSEHSVEYWIDYYTDNEKGRAAKAGDAVIELAWNFPLEGGQLESIVSGASDSYIIETMKYLETLNTVVLLRVGAEMNVWTTLPDESLYISAFRRIAGYARQYASNVALVFSPNDVSSWGKSYTDYYPGDEYADWIGVSTYYTGRGSTGNYLTDAFYTVGEYSYNPLARIRLLAETFPKKPIIISECGFAYYSQSTGDMTSAAIDRLRKFYACLTMQYPQVKAVLFYDNDYALSPLQYHFAGNTALKNAYLDVIKSETYLSSTGAAAKGYTKLSAVNERMDVLKLYTNALFPRAEAVSCTYFIDGTLIKTVTLPPYECEIPVKDLGAGTHTVKVNITCGNISRTVQRQIRVSADNIITGSDRLNDPPPPALVALPTTSLVVVDGEKVSFEAYNIEGNNYFKLRDLAYTLNNTNARFEVSWDGGANAITITTGQSYTPNGSEMKVGAATVKTPVPTNSIIILNGKEITLTAYNIDGSNFFKLRDIGAAINFNVSWKDNSIVIETSESYTDD